MNWVKCSNCRKLYTQTVYKKMKSLPVCPHCGTKKQDNERPVRKRKEGPSSQAS